MPVVIVVVVVDSGALQPSLWPRLPVPLPAVPVQTWIPLAAELPLPVAVAMAALQAPQSMVARVYRHWLPWRPLLSVPRASVGW